LRSIRELAARGESEDAAVLARALLALTYRYLWLAAATDDADERRDRLQRLVRKWAEEQATVGEELIELDYMPRDATSTEFRESVRQFRDTAERLGRECVRKLPSERDLARRLDRDLDLSRPRWFELMYARIYRPTSQVAHYGLSAAANRFAREPDRMGELSLERVDEEGAAEALGLALVAYAVFLDFTDAIVRHGITREVAELIDAAHRA
jgi:hypothetical protein